MTTGLLGELKGAIAPLLDLGLGYLGLDRAGATLSTGERQRIELTSTVRANTTGMLYVLDEPSVGLHPSNVEGLRKTIAALAGNGNTVVIVEHDLDLIRTADWVIELGPGAGRLGGTIVAEGTPDQIQRNRKSIIGPFLDGGPAVDRPPRPLPRERVTDRRAAPLQPAQRDRRLPDQPDDRAGRPVRRRQDRAGAGQPDPGGPGAVGRRCVARARQVARPRLGPPGGGDRRDPDRAERAVDAEHVLGRFRRHPRATSPPRRAVRAGHFSFNTKEGQCPTCRGIGSIDLDVQYLPDINVECPTCHGARFNDETLAVRVDGLTIADVLDLTVREALDRYAEVPRDRAPVAADPRCRAGLSAPGRADAVAVRRRVATAAHRGPPAQQPARRPLCARRAVDGPAPGGHPHARRRLRPAPRQTARRSS